MSDILERLGNYIPGENEDQIADRLAEAIAEIKRLRKALEAVAASKMPGESRRIAIEELRRPAPPSVDRGSK